MLKYHLIVGFSVLVMTFPSSLIANDYVWTDNGYDMNWTSGDLKITLAQWSTIDKLQAYNNVTVEMYGGGGNQFYMYDNSSLTMYGGSINYLYLYDNATVSIFLNSYMNTLYIDPASTGWVKLYAKNVTFEALGGNPGQGTLYGNWLAGGYFGFDLTGNGAYSHIQIVPEPATLIMLCIGGLALRKKR